MTTPGSRQQVPNHKADVPVRMNGDSTADAGDVLTWDGTEWRPGPVDELAIPDDIVRDSDLSTALAALVNSAPSTLDTLAEIAAALGSDPNLATTLTNLIALKAALAGATFTGDVAVPDAAYDITAWDGSTKVPTRNAVRDALVAAKTAADAAYVLQTLADAKGDLVAASAADTWGKLAVGTDTWVLTADSTQTLGVKWAPGGAASSIAATQAGTAGAPTTTTLMQFNAPSGDTHGPFSLVVGGALFQSTFDRVMYLGYNAADGGGKLVAGEPKYSLQIESDYDDGTKRVIESYWEYAPAAATTLTDGVTTSGSPTVTSAATTFTSTKHVGQGISGTGIPASTYIGVVNSAHSIGLSSSATANTPVNATASNTGLTLTMTPGGSAGMRPEFRQINRATGKMTDHEIRTSGITYTDWDTNATWGVMNSTGLSLTGLATQTSDTGLVLSAQNGKVCFIQLGAPSGSGIIIQRVSSNWWEINCGGSVVAWTSAATGKLRVNHDIGGNATFMAQTVTAQKDTCDTIVAKKVASQTVPLMAILDENGTRYGWRIGSTGYVLISKVAAPADADLSANDMALWFDATNGAGKLMVKAKTANGTVVTGSLALT